MTKLFEVKNFDKTLLKHAKRISSLQTRMEELGIDYFDILGSDAWLTIDTEIHNRLSMFKSMEIEQTDRQTATLINAITRTAIRGSLKFYDMPESWDTAFFMANYTKIIEGMTEVLNQG